jgi:hypothetical protein
MFSLSFTYEFRVPSAQDSFPIPSLQETEIYLPTRRYGHLFASSAVRISTSDGTWTWDESAQTLRWKHTDLVPGTVHTLEIKVPDRKHWKSKPANIDLDESPLRWVLGVLLAVLIAILARTVME